MHKLREEVTQLKKESLASVVKRLGNPESTAILHSACTIFHIPQVDGIIGYQLVGKCAVVIGEPICMPEDVAELTKAFHDYCSEHHLKIVYLMAHRDFANWAIKNRCRTLIQVGSELNIDPINFHKRQKLRWKVNQALKSGVEIKEYKSFDFEIEGQLKTMVQAWAKERHGPQIHLGNLNFFSDEAEHRIFYAQRNDKVIGILVLSPIDRYQGWVMSCYLAIEEAPVGTTEHMICFAIDTLAKENCRFLCLGAVSGTKLGAVIGMNAIIKVMANLIFYFARWLFKLDAKAIYLHKYHPEAQPTYLLFSDKLTFTELFAMAKALSVKL